MAEQAQPQASRIARSCLKIVRTWCLPVNGVGPLKQRLILWYFYNLAEYSGLSSI
jgi:hypothetical protein